MLLTTRLLSDIPPFKPTCSTTTADTSTSAIASTSTRTTTDTGELDGSYQRLLSDIPPYIPTGAIQPSTLDTPQHHNPT